MRSLMILLFLPFCSLQISNTKQSVDLANSNCCIGNLTNVKIPLKRIESYYWTSTICPKPRAVVFKTITGTQICVNPESPFVKNQMKKLDKSGEKRLKV